MKKKPNSSWPNFQKEFSNHAWKQHGKLFKDLAPSESFVALGMWADGLSAKKTVHDIFGPSTADRLKMLQSRKLRRR